MPRLIGDDNRRRADSIEELLEGSEDTKRILDFGCGEGEFLQALFSKTGERAVGYDLDVSALNAVETEGFETHTNLNDGMSWDLVTMFHVIEHLYDPISTLTTVRNAMLPGSYLVIETPNAEDALITLFECEPFLKFTFWSHHPILYSLRRLVEVVNDAGFKVEVATTFSRYSLDNHLYWLSKGQPGGHLHFGGHFSNELKLLYAQELRKQGMGDTIWLQASVR